MDKIDLCRWKRWRDINRSRCRSGGDWSMVDEAASQAREHCQQCVLEVWLWSTV